MRRTWMGWETNGGRKKEGRRTEETTRRYEKPPPLGIELWLPARLRGKSDSAPSLSEYNCIYLDSPDWIIGERGERETCSLSSDLLPRSSASSNISLPQWKFTQLSGDSVSFVISPFLLSPLRDAKNAFFTVTSRAYVSFFHRTRLTLSVYPIIAFDRKILTENPHINIQQFSAISLYRLTTNLFSTFCLIDAREEKKLPLSRAS